DSPPVRSRCSFFALVPAISFFCLLFVFPVTSVFYGSRNRLIRPFQTLSFVQIYFKRAKDIYSTLGISSFSAVTGPAYEDEESCLPSSWY
ncbi:8391_t:CDS:1, partial [Ambispora gerdemannii]